MFSLFFSGLSHLIVVRIFNNSMLIVQRVMIYYWVPTYIICLTIFSCAQISLYSIYFIKYSEAMENISLYLKKNRRALVMLSNT